MKAWWQSKIIWTAIAAFIGSVGELIAVSPPFDWAAAGGAVLALLVIIFRSTSKTTIK